MSFVGSKSAMGASERIISEMPRHELYIEAFAGTGAVGRLKKPSASELFVERDPRTAASLRAALGARAQVICGDCTRVVDPARVPREAVLYADPPYLLSVRASKKRYYRYEMLSDNDHARFLEWARALPCRVLISGYWSELYAARLEGWRLVQFGVSTRGGRAVESLWCNFPAMPDRHDTRFMGEGFRERERIRRKAKRWGRRLQAMAPGERAAVLAMLGESGSTPAGSPTATVRACIVTKRVEVLTPQLELL
jgi:DNA adenine methylase